MLIETGRVTKISDSHAWVETQSHTACSSCAVSKGCGTGLMNKAAAQRLFVTPVENTIHAKVDDWVELAIPENTVVKASLLVYCIPLFSMILATLISPFVMNNVLGLSAEWLTIVSAIAGLGAGFYAVHILDKRHTVSTAFDRKSDSKPNETLHLVKIVNETIPVKHIETV